MSMRITVLPKTPLGRWSVWLAVAWILFFVLSMFAAESGLVKLPLSGRALDFAMLGVTGGISLASLITGLISIIKSKERSILVFLALLVALLIVAMAILEVVTGGLGEIPAQRVSPPEVAVTVSAGQSLTFTAAAQDPDGNLQTVIWKVSGKVEKRVDLAGGQAQESFERAFPDVGQFLVEARFTAAGYRIGFVRWRVTVKLP